jgi:hypothetical protein
MLRKKLRKRSTVSTRIKRKSQVSGRRVSSKHVDCNVDSTEQDYLCTIKKTDLLIPFGSHLPEFSTHRHDSKISPYYLTLKFNAVYA